MSVVVGYVPTREGETALEHAWPRPARGGTRLVVVNTSRGDALVDQRYVDDEQLAALEQRLRTGVRPRRGHTASAGRDASEEILAVAREHRRSWS